jgi:hypothetical protein
MHVLKRATGRRRAGIAAAMMVTGGLAGTMLLTPGTALAQTPVSTTTAITGTHQYAESSGTGLQVDVAVTATSGTAAPAGDFAVSDGASKCYGTLTLPASGLTSYGSCDFNGLAAGPYNLVAGFDGATGFVGSVSANYPVTVTAVGSAPQWTADNPPLSATSGHEYSYDFQASGGASYSLGSGSAGWLSINTSNGDVYGTVPSGIHSFGYQVIASNSEGTIDTQWFTVSVNSGRHYSDLSTRLACPTWVTTGQHGVCTLYVTNDGWQQSNNVDAQVALPSQLQADRCTTGWTYTPGQGWGWGSGCSISGNVASEDIGNLNPGQTKELSVVFTVERPGWIWGWHRQRPEHVWVVGSASEYNSYGWYQRASYTAARVTIYPRWW